MRTLNRDNCSRTNSSLKAAFNLSDWCNWWVSYFTIKPKRYNYFSNLVLCARTRAMSFSSRYFEWLWFPLDPPRCRYSPRYLSSSRSRSVRRSVTYVTLFSSTLFSSLCFLHTFPLIRNSFTSP